MMLRSHSRSPGSHLNTTFLIGSAENEAALELSSYDLSFFLATLRSRGVNGTARVGTYMSNGLAELFAYFAENWKGWEGSKKLVFTRG
jgi:hypothetical protein